MSFYVYQNWHRMRTRVHRDACSNCNDGRGKQPIDSGKNGKWQPPFDSCAAAVALMKSFGYPDSKPCEICKP